MWGGIKQTHLRPLQVLQNTALKRIYNKPKLYSTKQLYEETKQLNINALYILNAIIYLAKEGKINQESREKTIKNVKTRREKNLCIRLQKTSKKIGEIFFRYIRIKIINELPLAIRAIVLNYENYL